MKFFMKKELSESDLKKYEDLRVIRDKYEEDFNNAPLHTKEKGVMLVKYIKTYEEMIKIKRCSGDRKAILILKMLYGDGVIMGKWKGEFIWGRNKKRI